MKITTKNTTIVTGVTIELTNDDAANLSTALKGYQEARRQIGGRLPWSWLDNLITELDAARGAGCVGYMGREK